MTALEQLKENNKKLKEILNFNSAKLNELRATIEKLEQSNKLINKGNDIFV